MTNSVEYDRKYRKEHPIYVEQHNRKTRERRVALRELVLDKYGRICVKCGSGLSLELDHVWPIVRVSGHNNAESEWIDALVFPKKYFQILCHTCNMKKKEKDNASY